MLFIGRPLVPMVFPPPWSAISGFDYSMAAEHCAGLSVKLLPMHWPMIIRSYGEALKSNNDALDNRLITRFLSRALDIADDLNSFEHLSHPKEDEIFPASLESQQRKIHQAQALAGDMPIYALVHSFGPMDDFRIRLENAYAAANNRVWICRYGYMSDDKLDIVGSVTKS